MPYKNYENTNNSTKKKEYRKNEYEAPHKKTRLRSQVLRKGEQILLHMWYLACYFYAITYIFLIFLKYIFLILFFRANSP